jgi:hypothetical protein
MDILTELANKYKSDKGTLHGSCHGFTKFYNQYLSTLRNTTSNILEIGINDGASLKMWEEYFPNSIIYGLDIDDKSEFDTNRIVTNLLDQSNNEHLEYFSNNIGVEFDFIIDDGSHHISDQQLTFFYLFKLLKPGGLYIIEDLHTSLCNPGTILYNRIVQNNDIYSNTTLTYLKNKPYTSLFLTKDQNEFLQKSIKIVEIFERDNDKVPDDYKNQSITSIILKK